MGSPASLFLRGVLAILLMVMFYVLALGIAAGLFALPIAELVYSHRIHPKLVVLSVIGGAVILWSVFPRIDRFAPPGPALEAKDHPALFEAIRAVSERTQQAMPAEVYLAPDMNAFVAQRGGVMGFFSRRVMGIGLPLMQVLTVSQLKAVLAHEFGHFYGGDTKLGPWIYKTRGALMRTVMNLLKVGSSLLSKPFEWFGILFLRVTQAISRHQEYAADQLAARAIGASHLISGLKIVHGAGGAFEVYWRTEVVPVLESGHRTPLASGFAAFMQRDELKKAVDDVVQEQMSSEESDPFDTHPPLPQRVAALERAAVGPAPENDVRPAIDLLADVAALERGLLVFLAGADAVAKLSDVPWTEVGEKVYRPLWGRRLEQLRKIVGTPPLADLPTSAEALARLTERMLGADAKNLPGRQQVDFAASIVASSVAYTLAQDGWAIETSPGAPFVLRSGEKRFEPFRVIGELASEKPPAKGWADTVAELGVGGVMLAAS